MALSRQSCCSSVGRRQLSRTRLRLLPVAMVTGEQPSRSPQYGQGRVPTLTHGRPDDAFTHAAPPCVCPDFEPHVGAEMTASGPTINKAKKSRREMSTCSNPNHPTQNYDTLRSDRTQGSPPARSHCLHTCSEDDRLMRSRRKTRSIFVLGPAAWSGEQNRRRTC